MVESMDKRKNLRALSREIERQITNDSESPDNGINQSFLFISRSFVDVVFFERTCTTSFLRISQLLLDKNIHLLCNLRTFLKHIHWVIFSWVIFLSYASCCDVRPPHSQHVWISSLRTPYEINLARFYCTCFSRSSGTETSKKLVEMSSAKLCTCP